MDEGERSATNIMVLDSTTLMSILVIAVFVIKVFNRVLQSNSAANLPIRGRRKRDARMRQYLRTGDRHRKLPSYNPIMR